MKIRVATIGTGFIVDSFIAAAQHDSRYELAAVYSRTPQRGEEFAARHGAGRVITSLEELAAAPDIDAVYVASPNSCHAEQAIMMMNHKKSVLCEKPMAPDPEDILRMTEAARRNGVALMEAMKTTLLPNFRQVQQALPRIGRVRRYNVQFCQYSSRYDKFREGIVENCFNPQMRGGALQDLGVYGIAPMVHLFGVPWSGECTPEKLRRHISIFSTTIFPGGDGLFNADGRRIDGIDGQGVLVAHYPDFEATVTYSKITDSALPSEIQGEEGTILISKLSQMTTPSLVLRKGAGSRHDSGYHNNPNQTRDEVIDISAPTISDNMYYEVKEFFDLIEQSLCESSYNTWNRSLQVAQIVSAGSIA